MEYVWGSVVEGGSTGSAYKWQTGIGTTVDSSNGNTAYIVAEMAWWSRYAIDVYAKGNISGNGASGDWSGSLRGSSNSAEGNYGYGIKSISTSVSRGHSAKSVTFNAWIQTTGGFAPGTSSVSTTVTIPAKQSWTVSYDLNGGSGSFTSQTKWYDEALYVPSAKPTKSGYTFKGWGVRGREGEGLKPDVAYYPPGDRIDYHGSQTLVAVWTANDYAYNIEYVSSSGKSLGSETVTHAFGGTYTVSAPAKAGYNTPDSQSVKWDSTNAKTITFTYSLISYSISYDLDGGTVSGNPTSYNVESPAITLKNPTKTRYDFKGWTGSNGSLSMTVTIPTGSIGNKSYTANWILLASRITVYTQDGVAHRGLVHIYDDNGYLHYGIVTVYDSSGNAHDVI